MLIDREQGIEPLGDHEGEQLAVPLGRPAHLHHVTDVVTCQVVLKRLGTHSSSNSRMSLGHFAGQFERRNCLLTGYGWEIMQEVVKRVAGLEVIVEVLHRYTCADEHGSATQNLWVAVNDRRLGR